jgi:hypothetical protein
MLYTALAHTATSLGGEQVSPPETVVSGMFIDADTPLQGYCGLGRSVNALGLSTKETIDVDIVVRPGFRTRRGFRIPPGSRIPQVPLRQGLLSAVRADSPSQCSSLGAVNFDLLRMMYGACQGMSQSRTRCRKPPTISSQAYASVPFSRRRWHEGIRAQNIEEGR